MSKFRSFVASEEGMRPNKFRIISNGIGHSNYINYRSKLGNIVHRFPNSNIYFEKTFLLFIRLKYRNKL
jgi:hypothetical protein